LWAVTSVALARRWNDARPTTSMGRSERTSISNGRTGVHYRTTQFLPVDVLGLNGDR
jgi:hypothetical protein